jgi:hypothetical protein
MKRSAKRLIRSKEDGIGVFGTWAFVVIYCALAFPLFYVFAFADKSLMGGLIAGFFAIFGVVFVLGTAGVLTAVLEPLGSVGCSILALILFVTP